MEPQPWEARGATPDALMPSAIVTMDGTDPQTLKAPADGQVSVYDLTIDNLIYSGLIHKDQLLVIDPASRNVTIDGKIANSKPLYGGDSLKILFDETR